jgi:oxygen-dependent protoporphyrinogen oxidase
VRAIADRQDNVSEQQPDPGDRRSVAVVGAGITGLVAAYELRRRGVNVTLYESSEHSGGAIRTTHAEGFLAEHGPNSFVTSAPVEALLDELDLLDDVVEANPDANRRYVVRNGALVPFPLSPPAMLGTRLFSFRAKLRVLLEPLVRRSADDSDESVASFVRRRLGHEVLDYAVDPFISGIFAGDVETLSMAHAFPRVYALERTYGSLSRGLMAQRRNAQPIAQTASSADTGASGTSASGTGADGAPVRTRLISFIDGMQTLTDALEAALVGTLRLGCPVRLLHQDDSRWIVDAGPEGAAKARAFDAVVMATPAHVLAAMELPGAMRKHATPVERVEYPPVSTITLGFRRADVSHPLDGFGMLIPAVENRSVLGALFSSSLFPARAPTDHVAITCFVGGARHPQLAREGTAALTERVLVDLRELVGVRGTPVYAHHVFWPRAIPQYTVGYAAVKAAADATEAANPGMYLAGNYRGGVSVGDCVASGQQIAQRVEAYLARAN